VLVSAARLSPPVCVLALLAVLACASPARATETGIVTAPGQTVSTIDRSADLGVGWVRLFVGWKDIEPAKGAFNDAFVTGFAREVAAFRARGIKVLLVVTGSPAWASGSPSGFGGPVNPADYAAFVDHLAGGIPGVGAWEIWNEADGNIFWENGPNPPAYAALLRAAYPVIKAHDPNAIVVSTGMVGADSEFLQAIYDSGAQGFFDAVGVHTDHACLVVPPDSFYRETDGRVGRYAFTGYREIHHLMTLNGDGAKPIWMTELGWNTQSTAANSCRDGGQAGTKPAGVTEAAQAANLTAAYRCLAADPFVTVAMWFSLQDIPGSTHYDGHLGLLRADGAAKPAYAALKALRGGAGITPDPGCGGLLDHDAPGLQVLRPSNGLRFVDLLSLRANAADTAGGAGMSTVELLADGTRVVKSKGGTFRLDPWFRAGQRLGLGPHTLTFRARDNAGNITERAVQVEKVLPSQLPPIGTRLTLRARARAGRRVRLSGNLTHAPSELPEGGRIYISLERRIGGRYRRVKQVSVTARRPFARILLVPGTGRFRALARYKGAAPFRPSRSPYRAFTAR
jgi:hypothetical protein